LSIRFQDGGGVRPGVMQIDVEYATAFERAYIASRARRPLIELAPGEREPAITVETSDRATLIRCAMEKTVLADSGLYERLPIPVRYRASGALEAWRQVREDAGRSGDDFSRRLTSESLGDLMHSFPQYLRSWARGNLSCIGDEDDMGHAQRGVIMRAFSASHGALYEPTAALHRRRIRRFRRDGEMQRQSAARTDGPHQCCEVDVDESELVWDRGVFEQ
jgi:hypothetical protein